MAFGARPSFDPVLSAGAPRSARLRWQPEVLEHQAGRGARRPDHARNAGARMRAGADQVDVGNLLVAVVWPEERRLPQYRFDRKRRAEVRIEFVAETERRQRATGDQVLLQPRQIGPL